MPVVAANMETVTEARMAIAMARAGGVGIIHRFLTVADQVAMVERVKRAENLVIDGAVPRAGERDGRRGARADARCTTSRACSLEDARRAARRHPHAARPAARPAGRRSRDGARDAARAPGTAPPGTDIDTARDLLHANRIEKLPLVHPDGRIAGLVTVRDLVALRERPHASKDDRGRLLVGAAVGVRGDYLERSAALVEAGVDLLVLDIAHGHADHAVAALERMRANHPRRRSSWPATSRRPRAPTTCAARAPTRSRSASGPGSVCTTRVVAGVGVPQLSAVVEAVAACRRTASRSSPTAASVPRATRRRRSRPARRR